MQSRLTRTGEALLNSARSIRLSSLSRPRHLQEKTLPNQRKHRPGIDFIEEREKLEVLCQVHLRNYKTVLLTRTSRRRVITKNTCTKSTHQQYPEFASRHVIVAAATSSLAPSDRQRRMLKTLPLDPKYPPDTPKQTAYPITVWIPFAA